MRTDFAVEKMKRPRHRNQNVAQISYCFESIERNEKHGRNDSMNWRMGHKAIPLETQRLPV